MSNSVSATAPRTPEKVFWQSKGFWGPVIAMIGMVFDMRGWGSVDQAALWGAVDQIMTWGGVVLGAWGRIAAKERLVLRKPTVPPPTYLGGGYVDGGATPHGGV